MDTWRIYARVGPEDRQAKALVVGSLACVIGFQIEGLFEYNFGDSEVITLTYFLMALPFVVHHACRRRPPVAIGECLRGGEGRREAMERRAGA